MESDKWVINDDEVGSVYSDVIASDDAETEKKMKLPRPSLNLIADFVAPKSISFNAFMQNLAAREDKLALVSSLSSKAEEEIEVNRYSVLDNAATYSIIIET